MKNNIPYLFATPLPVYRGKTLIRASIMASFPCLHLEKILLHFSSLPYTHTHTHTRFTPFYLSSIYYTALWKSLWFGKYFPSSNFATKNSQEGEFKTRKIHWSAIFNTATRVAHAGSQCSEGREKAAFDPQPSYEIFIAYLAATRLILGMELAWASLRALIFNYIHIHFGLWRWHTWNPKFGSNIL